MADSEPFVVDDDAAELGPQTGASQAKQSERVRKSLRLLELIVRQAVHLNEKEGEQGEWARHYLARSDTKANTGNQFAVGQLANAVANDRPGLLACGLDNISPNVKVCSARFVLLDFLA